MLRPFFPEWINNLEFAEPEVRDGVFHFKVSLGKPWRRIAIPAKSDLDELAELAKGNTSVALLMAGVILAVALLTASAVDRIVVAFTDALF